MPVLIVSFRFQGGGRQAASCHSVTATACSEQNNSCRRMPAAAGPREKEEYKPKEIMAAESCVLLNLASIVVHHNSTATMPEVLCTHSLVQKQDRILAALQLEHAAAEKRAEQEGNLEAMELLEREQRKELETLQNVLRWESHHKTCSISSQHDDR